MAHRLRRVCVTLGISMLAACGGGDSVAPPPTSGGRATVDRADEVTGSQDDYFGAAVPAGALSLANSLFLLP